MFYRAVSCQKCSCVCRGFRELTLLKVTTAWAPARTVKRCRCLPEPDLIENVFDADGFWLL